MATVSHLHTVNSEFWKHDGDDKTEPLGKNQSGRLCLEHASLVPWNIQKVDVIGVQSTFKIFCLASEMPTLPHP